MLETLRNINVVLGVLGALGLLWQLASLWGKAPASQRLRFMSLILLIATVTYGTFEILYLGTNYRVPLLTVSLTWCLASLIESNGWKRPK